MKKNIFKNAHFNRTQMSELLIAFVCEQNVRIKQN